MSDEAQWAELRPILQDLTARIARIEQFLAASGLQANPGSASFDAPFPAQSSGPVPDYLLVLAKSGNKVQAISELRRITGMSLKDAKAVIDSAVRGY